jgi:nicotinamide-nucleotide amidase
MWLILSPFVCLIDNDFLLIDSPIRSIAIGITLKLALLCQKLLIVLTEIITIGDELLIGQVVDTNSAWIATQLNAIGIRVFQITSVSDNEDHIMQALELATTRADVIILTGGLGPTKDDITKKTLCRYFNTGLRFDEQSFKIIESIFKSRGREVTDINRKQAEVPQNCTVLINQKGTAPGMWFEKNEKIYISMPGVPTEMKGLVSNEMIPRLKERYVLPPYVHKTILTQGIGESTLSELIASWEDNLPASMKLAYLPASGMVRLRISATGKKETEIRLAVNEEVEKLKQIIPEHIYGYDEDRLEEIVGKLLRDQKKTISTAESCTGGFIAHRITSIPGSSEYYIGSVVAYANEIKTSELGVDMEVIEKYGAVSEQVVKQMASHAIKIFKTDFSIACSGIAGPDGGTTEKPVGTVWLAIASPEKIITRKLQLGNNRERVILETAQHALNLVRKILIGEL